MLNKIIKVLIIIGVVLGIGYGAVCAYGNFAPQKIPGTVTMPDVKDAQYSVYVKNTGSIFLTSDYEQFGEKVGARTFILHGYWIVSGQEFIYKDKEVTINESAFGQIDVRRRVTVPK